MSTPVNLEERTNWVELRAKCNIENAFDALVQEIRRDVAEANRLPDLGGGEFVIAQCDKDLSVSLGAPQNAYGRPVPAVRIHAGSSEIRVYGDADNGFSSEQLIFEVVPTWDSKNASCCMRVGKEILKPWQISQRALEALFFDRKA